MIDSNASDRLQQLIQLLDAKSVSHFAAAIGVSSTVLANMLGGRKSKPSFETLEKIKAAYPRVNLEWLVTGQGQPLLTPASYAAPETEMQVQEPAYRRLGKPAAPEEETAAALQECRKELAFWIEKANTYKQLAEDRQTIIELMKKAQKS
ncbi:XRE family transcriptional regulator [Hymenobacter gummosus]|uniref:XRE family transcriptional regulator n=1 Tax=Hymenobacter gummosus TaxID=1776032 RepID=A0A3S0JDV3_9BACT|nr:helix-turn-helix transcriptional regulator [Hymenobacter gummosus]RTQ46080.1 XRE family transcriptional regulator [Hymenobacter gummosus]